MVSKRMSKSNVKKTDKVLQRHLGVPFERDFVTDRFFFHSIIF